VHPFRYLAAHSIDEAVAALAQYGPRARTMAGGTDLLVQLRAGRYEMDAVVDVKHVPELTALTWDGGALTIGAAVPCYRVYEDERIAAAFPGIIDGASIIGGIQVQSRASLGGNLCNAAPSGDAICPLIVHGAIAHVAGPKGKRTMPVSQVPTGPGRNALGEGGFLVAIELPAPARGFGAAYQRFTPRNEMDIAVAGVASALTLDGSGRIASATIALASVGPTPIVAAEAAASLVGKEPSAAAFAEAGQIAAREARPITDMRGTEVQRRKLVSVLTRRTLEQALARATGANA
jgi:CO/xanthine dehydrogenase FAD-binding subunit